jgi:hypothetical protein
MYDLVTPEGRGLPLGGLGDGARHCRANGPNGMFVTVMRQRYGERVQECNVLKGPKIADVAYSLEKLLIEMALLEANTDSYLYCSSKSSKSVVSFLAELRHTNSSLCARGLGAPSMLDWESTRDGALQPHVQGTPYIRVATRLQPCDLLSC